MRYLLLLALLLTGCAHGDELTAVLSQPVDTTVQHQVARQLHTGRVKFKGTVTFQIGGTNNTATATDASKAKAPVAAAPHAVATETKAAAGAPLWPYLVGALVVFAGGFYVRGRLKIPLPF